LRRLPPARALAREPVVELDRGVDVQALEQLAAVERRGFAQVGRLVGRGEGGEPGGVEIDRRPGDDAVAIDHQALGQGRRQTQQGGPQGSTRGLRVGAAPEQLRQLAARVACAAQRQVAEQAQRLARGARDRPARRMQARLTEQVHG